MTETVLPALTVGGKPVLGGAMCAFQLTPPAPPPPLPVPATLAATPGALVIGGTAPLTDGASVTVSGNRLRVGTAPDGPLVIGG